jgi:hypothetical protein
MLLSTDYAQIYLKAHSHLYPTDRKMCEPHNQSDTIETNESILTGNQTLAVEPDQCNSHTEYTLDLW